MYKYKYTERYKRSSKEINYSISFWFCLVCTAGDRTQSLKQARQAFLQK